MSFIGIEDIDILLMRILDIEDFKNLANSSRYYYEKSNNHHLGCLLVQERFNIPYYVISALSNPKEFLIRLYNTILKDFNHSRELVLMKIAVKYNYISIIKYQLPLIFKQEDDDIVFFDELFSSSVRSFRDSTTHNESLETLSYLIKFIRDNLSKDDSNLSLSRALKDFVGVDDEAMMMLAKEVRGTGISSHFDFYNGEDDPLMKAIGLSDTIVFTLLIKNLCPIDYDFYLLLHELAQRGEIKLVITMLELDYSLEEKIFAISSIMEDDDHSAPISLILQNYLEEHS